MTRPMSEEREDVLEAAQRVVDAFAWAANYKPHRNRPERDAFHAARALLSILASERGRSDISFERAAEMAETLLALHERGLQLAEAGPDAAEDWAKNAADYRSVCYVAAPVLAVKLIDALARPSASERGMREALEKIIDLDHHNHGPASRASEIARAALSPKGEG